MKTLPHQRFLWAHPDRRDLYRSVSILASPRATKGPVQIALYRLLVDLEIYDDPRQGIGSWLWPDEAVPVDQLSVKLQNLVADASQDRWGEEALRHPGWDEARNSAAALKRTIEGNGEGQVTR